MTEIEFDDIRVGDRISATLKYESGEQAVYTGIVTLANPNDVDTQEFCFTNTPMYSFQLVSRPLPEEPSGLGAVVTVGVIRYVRVSRGDTHPWYETASGEMFDWAEVTEMLDTLDVLSEGVPT